MLLAAVPGKVGDGAKKTITNVDGAASEGRRRPSSARRGEANLRRFLVGPKDCEITGIARRRTASAVRQHPASGRDDVDRATSARRQLHQQLARRRRRAPALGDDRDHPQRRRRSGRGTRLTRRGAFPPAARGIARAGGSSRCSCWRRRPRRRRMRRAAERCTPTSAPVATPIRPAAARSIRSYEPRTRSARPSAASRRCASWAMSSCPPTWPTSPRTSTGPRSAVQRAGLRGQRPVGERDPAVVGPVRHAVCGSHAADRRLAHVRRAGHPIWLHFHDAGKLDRPGHLRLPTVSQRRADRPPPRRAPARRHRRRRTSAPSRSCSRRATWPMSRSWWRVRVAHRIWRVALPR